MPDETKVAARIEARFLSLRGEEVLLDHDLAELYGIETRRLNEQVRRNQDRFPPDFMFRLTRAEVENLKSQTATSSREHGGRRKLPLVLQLVTDSELEPAIAERLEIAARGGVSADDAGFVFVAEQLDLPLVTADRKLAKAFPARAATPEEFTLGGVGARRVT